MTPVSKETMDVNDEVLVRIRILERSVEAMRLAEIASLQRWRFVVLVILHGTVASALTVIAAVYPIKLVIAFVNAWMLGFFLWSLLWFSASPRALVDRASRLFLSALAILFMLRETTELCFGMFPDVAVVAAFVSPFVVLAARWTVALTRTSLNAPDIPERGTHPLSIVDFLIAATLVALLSAMFRTQESDAVFRPLIIIVLALVPTVILSSMLVFFAKAKNCFVRVTIIGLSVFAMSLFTLGAWSLLGSAIQDLSFVDIQERNSFADAWSPLTVLTIVIFAMVVVMPSIMTLGLLHYQGYRTICESRRTS